MKTMIALIPLLFLSASANAGWEFTGSARDLFDLYIDTNTVRSESGYKLIWELKSYKQPESDEFGSHQSTKSLMVYDCQKQTFGIKSLLQYESKMGQGSIVFSSSPRTIHQVDFFDIVPDSIAETVWITVCRGG